MLYIVILASISFVISCALTAYTFVMGDVTWIAFLAAAVISIFFAVGAYNERSKYSYGE